MRPPSIGTAWGVLDLYEESLRKRKTTVVLMTHNTVQPALAADSFGRMHFGLLPHGVEEGSGAGPPPVR